MKTEKQLQHEREAEERGLKLIGKGRDRQHRLYEFIECGHQQEISTSNVRRDRFVCQQCQQQKIEQEALNAGLKLIGEGKSHLYRLYEFIECGHQQEILVRSVRSDGFKCQECQQKKIEQEALNAGLKLIRKGKNKLYRLYQFIKCGHQQEIAVGNVRVGNPVCHRCQQQKIEQEALDAGLKLIGKGKSAWHRLYQCVECGHQQEITVGAVRIGEFICHNCEDSSWDKPSKLYAVIIKEDMFTWLKVGVAQDTQKRIKVYQLSESAVTEIKLEKQYNNRHESQAVEEQLHKKLKKHKIPKQTMKSYMQSGFDECYSIDALPLVEKLFEELD